MEIIDFIYDNFKFLESDSNFTSERDQNSIVYTNRYYILKFLVYAYEFSLEIKFRYRDYPEIYFVDLLNFLEKKALPIPFQSNRIEVIKNLLLDVKSLLFSHSNLLNGECDYQIGKYIKLYANKFNSNCDAALRHTASLLFWQRNYKEAYDVYGKMQELNELDKKKMDYSKKRCDR